MEEMVQDKPGDLHIFPELNLTGYLMKDEVTRLAESLEGPALQGVATLAREQETHIICGMPVLEKDFSIRNAALLLTPKGDIHPYYKSFLPNFNPFEEKLYYRSHPGEQGVIQTSFGKLGLLICYDLFFPEICLNYALQEVDYLVCISASPTTSRQLFQTVIPARAVESTAFFLYVNTVGSEEKLTFWGGSEGYSPRGTRLARAPYFQEASLEVEIDPCELSLARNLRPVIRDRNWLPGP